MTRAQVPANFSEWDYTKESVQPMQMFWPETLTRQYLIFQKSYHQQSGTDEIHPIPAFIS